MTLYEIDSAIMGLIDPETGEITDFDAFDALQIARDEKVENIALYYKNLTAEADAIKAEEQKLYERRKSIENKAANLFSYLKLSLNGEKFETTRVKCAFRAVHPLCFAPDFIEWAKQNADDLLTYKEPTPNVSKIKEAIKAGREVYGAEIMDEKSMSVK